MNVRFYVPLFSLMLLQLLPSRPLASAIPETKPFAATISGADIIVIARIIRYVPDPKALPTLNDTHTNQAKTAHIYYGMDAIVFASTVRKSGAYTFEVMQNLKGKVKGTIQVDLPHILSIYYGRVNFTPSVGNQVLLFLKSSDSKKLEVVDRTVPLIPARVLSDNKVKLSQENSVQSQIVQSMLLALDDQQNLIVNTYLLRDVVDPNIVMALAKYMNDANEKVQDNVLFCLATNQQVTTIPLISTLEAKLEAQGSGADSVLALSRFRTPEAVSYLNPTLLLPAYYTRLNAMFALNNLANHTSIPYLMLAVRDPDGQGIIPQSAYGMLHQLIPSLGEAYGSGYFADHRAAETRKLYAWWSDELLGRHLKPGERPAIPAEMPNTPALLNPLLFLPDTPTRRAAAAKLARLGDKSSIPYLVLALQDPDAQAPDVNVSYVAYKTLHRLIPSLGAVEDSESFAASHAAAAQPIYDWWRDELLGKHLPK